MKKARWTRGDKLAAAGVAVAVVALSLAVFVPEIRNKLGLETHLPPTPKEEREPEEPERASVASVAPPKIVAKQSTKTKVSGKNNVAGNNIAGDGNAVGNGNQVASPTLVIPGSGNAVSFGQQGGITAGTLNVATPPVHVKWEVVEGDDLSKLPKGEHPRSFVKMYVDQSVPDAKFVVVCDRPCQAKWNSGVAGANYTETFAAKDAPAFAGFLIVQPNPFPSFTSYTLGVESLDDAPVKILRVAIPTLTEEQKRSLLQ
jgi:hypothetical protein